MTSSDKNQPVHISNSTLNKLRAAVLGANDGIVSTSSVVMGVAGATSSKSAIFTAGLAALVAGALSMAVGEYVSVGSQRDAEEVRARRLKETTGDDLSSPSHAAIASFLAFSVGGAVPFLAVILAPGSTSIPVTVAAVFIALLITGYLSATVGGASRIRAMSRVIIGGLLAMAITYYIGTLFGGIVG